MRRKVFILKSMKRYRKKQCVAKEKFFKTCTFNNDKLQVNYIKYLRIIFIVTNNQVNMC